jgi:putative transposase
MDDALRRRIRIHISQNAWRKDIHLDCINGWTDHLHALICLGSEQTIAKVAQFLKGESSHWVNKEYPGRFNFEWQNEYYAESVSCSSLGAIRKYIARQEEHHRLKSNAEEVSDFLREHGVEG